jgi:hypothetical protein
MYLGRLTVSTAFHLLIYNVICFFGHRGIMEIPLKLLLRLTPLRASQRRRARERPQTDRENPPARK